MSFHFSEGIIYCYCCKGEHLKPNFKFVLPLGSYPYTASHCLLMILSQQQNSYVVDLNLGDLILTCSLKLHAYKFYI